LGSAILPVYSASGGPHGKGHITFNRTQEQYLDAGRRTLNIATNGGLTIVAVVRFTGTPGYNETFIDLGSGLRFNNIKIFREKTSSTLLVELVNGGSLTPWEGSLAAEISASDVIVQNEWLTIVVRYLESTRTYWLTVNNVGYTGASEAVTDRTVSVTWIGKPQPGPDFFNGDVAGVFVVDEYLTADATSAIADAMVRGVDLTDTSAASACTACGAGKYGNVTGQISEASCKACGAGKYFVGTNRREHN
jgi:hypothetical protein